jgi:hypothetical protein
VKAIFDAIGGFLSGGWTRRFFRAKAEASQEPWRANARAVREVTITSRPEMAEQECRRLLTLIGEERAAQTEGNLIEIVTRSSWRSSGTVVRIALAPVAEGTRITIAAWPGAQLFDWGESRRVVRTVADALGGHS